MGLEWRKVGMGTQTQPLMGVPTSAFRVACLYAESFVDGNNLEQKRQVSLVGDIAKRSRVGSDVILPEREGRACAPEEGNWRWDRELESTLSRPHEPLPRDTVV